MTDIIDELRQTAGNLINGVIEDGEVAVGMLCEAADEIERLRAAQPEPLTGCLHPGNEPLSCQYEGQCLSVSCDHHGKTWYGPRMTLEAQDPNLLYPKETK